jgi:hypothetical protein
VVFDLITPSSKRRHGVLIPGPTNPGINVYQSLTGTLGTETKLSIRRIADNIEYLTNPELCMEADTYWNNPIT